MWVLETRALLGSLITFYASDFPWKKNVPYYTLKIRIVLGLLTCAFIKITSNLTDFQSDKSNKLALLTNATPVSTAEATEQEEP